MNPQRQVLGVQLAVIAIAVPLWAAFWIGLGGVTGKALGVLAVIGTGFAGRYYLGRHRAAG